MTVFIFSSGMLRFFIALITASIAAALSSIASDATWSSFQTPNVIVALFAFFEELPDPPSYSTVRKVLSILENKGYVKHIEQNRRYVYLPTQSKRVARTSALKHLMNSLFENSAESVVSTLLDIAEPKISDDELRRLTRQIEKYRKERE